MMIAWRILFGACCLCAAGEAINEPPPIISAAPAFVATVPPDDFNTQRQLLVIDGLYAGVPYDDAVQEEAQNRRADQLLLAPDDETRQAILGEGWREADTINDFGPEYQVPYLAGEDPL